MDDRRTFTRVDQELLVSYAHFDIAQVKDDEGMAKTLNMSVRGLLLRLPRAVDIGARLQLALNLEGDVAEVVGKVVRCDADPSGDGMFDAGIELEYVPDRFAASVERLFADE